MAAAAAALPQLPPPPPAWRSNAAELLRSPRAAVAAAAVIVLFPILAMVWVILASMAARRIARVTCGESSFAVFVVDTITTAASVALVVLGVISLVIAVCSICVTAWTKKGDRAPALNEFITPEDHPLLCVLMFGTMAFLAFLLLTFVGLLLTLSNVKGSSAEMSGSAIVDVGVFSLVALNCFVVLPAFALFVGRKMNVIVWKLV